MINYVPDTDLTDACLEKIESESSLEQIESESSLEGCWRARRESSLTELLVYRVGRRARVAEWQSGRVECTGKGQC